MHGYRYLAFEITKSIYEMIEKEGFREFYYPSTGEGLRIPNFAEHPGDTLLQDSR